ncbi:hypothetical protein [Wolbachia endosymbiont (group A) of Agelastica alni]
MAVLLSCHPSSLLFLSSQCSFFCHPSSPFSCHPSSPFFVIPVLLFLLSE